MDSSAACGIREQAMRSGDASVQDRTMAVCRNWGWLLGCSMLLLLLLEWAQACGKLTVDPPTVLFGENIRASCAIPSNHCRMLKDGEIEVLWKLSGELLPGAQQYQHSDGTTVSNLTINHFNRTTASLGCYVLWNGTPQLVGLQTINAGYLPSRPKNLTCMMEIPKYKLMCQWDFRQDSLLPTSITLWGSKNKKPCQLPYDVIRCNASVNQHFCIFPRLSLQLYQVMSFWVSATNALGSAESERLCIDPMDVAKMEPPELKSIQSIRFQRDCISVDWKVAESGFHIKQVCELRYKTDVDPGWTVLPNISSTRPQIHFCGFLSDTDYRAQMRCRRHLGFGYWSKWSSGRDFTTHKTVPTGELDVWWKMKPAESGKKVDVQLLWKTMSQKDAGSKALSYWVSLNSGQKNRDPATICNTTETHCDFSTSAEIKRVYLTAYNAAGPSPAKEIVLFEKKGRPLPRIQVSPCNDHSFQVQWNPPRPLATGYIIEWHTVSSAEQGSSNVSWQKERGGSATWVQIKENIEPFQMYNISVYPLYKDGVGLPVHTTAYSSQKAPSSAPKLHLKSISKSEAELSWDPLPIEMQNGFITHYTIFWVSPSEETFSTVLNASSRSFTIKGLESSRMYKVHIMASTAVGGTNSTIMTLVTTLLNEKDILVIFLPFGMLLFAIIGLTLCFQRNNRMKNQFWPSIPDPANSSLGKWEPADLQEETLQAQSAREPSPVNISAITVLDKEAKKKPPTWRMTNSTPAPMCNLPKSYVHHSSSGQPSKETRPSSYVNGTGAVQYAQVVWDGYRDQQAPSPLYTRSDSTQPLLDNMTPSPKPYENLWFHGGQAEMGLCSQSFQEDTVFLKEPLMDFPLLRGLKIDGTEGLNNLRRL